MKDSPKQGCRPSEETSQIPRKTRSVRIPVGGVFIWQLPLVGALMCTVWVILYILPPPSSYGWHHQVKGVFMWQLPLVGALMCTVLVILYILTPPSSYGWHHQVKEVFMWRLPLVGALMCTVLVILYSLLPPSSYGWHHQVKDSTVPAISSTTPLPAVKEWASNFTLAHGGKLPPMPVQLKVISAVLLDDKVYITGIAFSSAGSSQVQLYSYMKNRWSALPEAPNFNAPIVVINNHITLIGGRDAETKSITNVLYTWVEDELKWKQILPPMPTKRLLSGACQHDGFLLVAGGIEKDILVVSTVHVYSFSTGCWSTPKALELPKPLRSHQLVVYEDNLYVMAGGTEFPMSLEHGLNHGAWRARWSDIVEAINLSSKVVKSVWTPIAKPPVLRPTVISCSNFLISVGGVKDGLPQRGIYRFVDGNADNQWIEVGKMSVGRFAHGVVPLEKRGTVLLVVGGYLQSTPMGDEVIERTNSVELVLL